MHAALEYARRGWPVFPCRPGEKTPPTTHGLRDASIDPDQITEWWRRWPSANVAIATGKASGLVVIDVDVKNDQAGAASFKSLQAEHGPLLTLMQRTPSDGWHLVFQHPGSEIKNRAALLPGIDIRGDGGYVVGAPSTTSAGAYEWLNSEPIAPLPDGLRKLLINGKNKPNGAAKSFDRESVLNGVPEGQRDDALFRYACSLQARRCTQAEAEVLVRQAAANCDPAFDAALAVEKVKRAYEHGGNAEAGALRVVDTDLSGHIAPPRYVVEPTIPRGYVTLLGGHGGSGKSLLALVLAAHCAAGRAWAGLPVISCRSLYVTLEDPADLVRLRLRRIVAAYDLPVDAIESAVTIADGTDACLAHEAAEYGARRLVLTPAFDDLRRLAAGHGLVVVDNASDAYAAGENDRRLVRGFMAGLTSIAREHDAAVLLLAHIDKNSAKYGAAGNSYSGSTAWHNSARSRLALADESDGRVELRHEKANLSRRIDPVPLHWTDDGVLMPATAGATTDNAASDAAAVLAAIAAAIAAGADVPTGRAGAATTFHILTTFPEFPKALRTKAGKARFWDAITRLQRAGEIEIETFTTPARHTRERWVLRQSARCAIPHTPPQEPAQLAPPVRGLRKLPATGATGATGARRSNAYRKARDGEL